MLGEINFTKFSISFISIGSESGLVNQKEKTSGPIFRKDVARRVFVSRMVQDSALLKVQSYSDISYRGRTLLRALPLNHLVFHGCQFEPCSGHM